ncbi:hypothetical protein [Streptomyces albidoflavus]|uniref:hypothetical protein n=1 Tax=Streptomyces albidoflavus TaxID=1886 RepID=UPI00101FCC4F|nr:hypothetical protein [Streptomyces albidoflavus]RZF02684.1 hypothetical protein C0R05_32675 [Streptomyces albidoflavus]
MRDTPRTTRVHTVQRHLANGGLIDLGLDQKEQIDGRPEQYETDGFAARQVVVDGVLLVVVGAYGPNWLRTLTEICGRLESRHVKCTAEAFASGLADHEVLVRWATSAELRARAQAQAERAKDVRDLIRQLDARSAAEEELRAREAAGQSGLF